MGWEQDRNRTGTGQEQDGNGSWTVTEWERNGNGTFIGCGYGSGRICEQDRNLVCTACILIGTCFYLLKFLAL